MPCVSDLPKAVWKSVRRQCKEINAGALVEGSDWEHLFAIASRQPLLLRAIAKTVEAMGDPITESTNNYCAGVPLGYCLP